MPRVTIEHNGALVHCSPSQVKSVMEQIGAGVPRRPALAEAARGISQFVEESHSHFAEAMQIDAPDLRHVVQAVRTLVFANFTGTSSWNCSKTLTVTMSLGASSGISLVPICAARRRSFRSWCSNSLTRPLEPPCMMVAEMHALALTCHALWMSSASLRMGTLMMGSSRMSSSMMDSPRVHNCRLMMGCSMVGWPRMGSMVGGPMVG